MPHFSPLYWVFLMLGFWFVFSLSGVVLWWSVKRSYELGV